MDHTVIDDLEFCHEDDIPRVHSKNNKNLLIRFPKPQPKHQDIRKYLATMYLMMSLQRLKACKHKSGPSVSSVYREKHHNSTQKIKVQMNWKALFCRAVFLKETS